MGVLLGSYLLECLNHYFQTQEKAYPMQKRAFKLLSLITIYEAPYTLHICDGGRSACHNKKLYPNRFFPLPYKRHINLSPIKNQIINLEITLKHLNSPKRCDIK